MSYRLPDRVLQSYLGSIWCSADIALPIMPSTAGTVRCKR